MNQCPSCKHAAHEPGKCHVTLGHHVIPICLCGDVVAPSSVSVQRQDDNPVRSLLLLGLELNTKEQLRQLAEQDRKNAVDSDTPQRAE